MTKKAFFKTKIQQIITNKIIKKFYLVVFVFTLGLLSGWFVKSFFSPNTTARKINTVRLNGYKFISPLLFCDAEQGGDTEEAKILKNKIQNMIDEKIQSKEIESASVYFRDYSSNDQLAINPKEKFYPASLGKIPIMIAYYKAAQTDPSILQKKLPVVSNLDLNSNQEIKPTKFATIGKSYTVDALIDLMIIYSDNNAYNLLARNIDTINPYLLKTIYQDLKIPYPEAVKPGEDFITASDFSYFLRVLYNSTYLRKDPSEKALKLLSKVEFKDGLAAPIGNKLVSHKFGLITYPDGYRELHDCGIIYAKNPYLLCVMTKSRSNLKTAQKTIQDISALVYNELNEPYFKNVQY